MILLRAVIRGGMLDAFLSGLKIFLAMMPFYTHFERKGCCIFGFFFEEFALEVLAKKGSF